MNCSYQPVAYCLLGVQLKSATASFHWCTKPFNKTTAIQLCKAVISTVCSAASCSCCSHMTAESSYIKAGNDTTTIIFLITHALTTLNYRRKSLIMWTGAHRKSCWVAEHRSGKDPQPCYNTDNILLQRVSTEVHVWKWQQVNVDTKEGGLRRASKIKVFKNMTFKFVITVF